MGPEDQVFIYEPDTTIRAHAKVAAPGKRVPTADVKAARVKRLAALVAAGTNACVVCDGGGRAAAFAIAPGQARDLTIARPLLERLPGAPLWVMGNRGYSTDARREHVWSVGAPQPRARV